MAHYAFIKDNLVTEVITGVDEDDTSTLPSEYSSWEEFYLTQRPGQDTCKRTSYNTVGNTHTDEGTPFRGNYAGVGFTYDSSNDVFIEPKPYPSWVLDEDKWQWKAPVDMPNEEGKFYNWNEDTTSWDEV
tara:strand:+ start:108 stop:497 length:390 start_codon:yes stop_codon:yes gene_type:complete